MNISDPMEKNKTDNLQFVFFNGVGWESWESIGIQLVCAMLKPRGVSQPLSAPLRLSCKAKSGALGADAPLSAIYALVNKLYTIVAERLRREVRILAAEDGVRYFDLYHGCTKNAADKRPVARRPHG